MIIALILVENIVRQALYQLRKDNKLDELELLLSLLIIFFCN